MSKRSPNFLQYYLSSKEILEPYHFSQKGPQIFCNITFVVRNVDPYHFCQKGPQIFCNIYARAIIVIIRSRIIGKSENFQISRKFSGNFQKKNSENFQEISRKKIQKSLKFDILSAKSISVTEIKWK